MPFEESDSLPSCEGVILNRVIDSNNRRIVQRRHSLRLTLKALRGTYRPGPARAQNLSATCGRGEYPQQHKRLHRTGSRLPLEYLVTVINRVGNRQVHKFSWITKTKTKIKM